MFVGDPSVKAECGTRPGTSWRMQVELAVSQGFMHMDWIWCLLDVVSSCHEVIPGGTKATIVGVDEEGDLPVFTDDGKTMATWCSIWLQVWEQCGPPIATSPTLQLQKWDVRTTSNSSFAQSSNVSLQIRWILCRSTSRGVLHPESFADVTFLRYL